MIEKIMSLLGLTKKIKKTVVSPISVKEKVKVRSLKVGDVILVPESQRLHHEGLRRGGYVHRQPKKVVVVGKQVFNKKSKGYRDVLLKVEANGMRMNLWMSLESSILLVRSEC